LVLLAAACSSSKLNRPTPPSTAVTSTTTTRPPSQGVVLDADGLGVARIGQSQASVIAAVTSSLEPPTTTTNGVCAGTTEVQWNDLSLEFSHNLLVGYRYREGGLAAVGSTPRSTVSGTPVLKTATGATLGVTLAAVRTLYPAKDFSLAQGGSIVVPGAHPGDRLFLGFFSDARTTPLSEVKGGHPCGDF